MTPADELQNSLVKSFETLDSTIGGLYVNKDAWRDAAVTRLIERGAEAVPKLIEVLKGDDAIRRFENSFYIAEFSRDIDWIVSAQSSAEKALIGIGESAVSAVFPLLESSKASERDAAIRILHGIGPPAVETLLVLLRRDNADIRAAAAAALAGSQDERVIATLSEVLKEEIARYQQAKRRNRIVYTISFLTIFPFYLFFFDRIPREYRFVANLLFQGMYPDHFSEQI